MDSLPRDLLAVFMVGMAMFAMALERRQTYRPRCYILSAIVGAAGGLGLWVVCAFVAITFGVVTVQ